MSHDLTGAVIVAVTWLGWWLADRLDPIPARWMASWAAFVWFWAVVDLLATDKQLTFVTEGAFAAWLAYHAWKRRKPRQRKPSKALGMVRDLGHRLVVTSS